MKIGRVLLSAVLLLMLSFASAELFRLPENLAVIESGAFSDVPVGDSLYVPETCLYLAPDAFGDVPLTVYGFRGGAGEHFARESGNVFTDVGIYDISYTVTGRMYTLLPVNIGISYDSPVPAAVTELKLISDTVELPISIGETVFDTPGSYDLSVTVDNGWTVKTVVFKDALTLGDTKAINDRVERLQFLPNWYYLEPGQSTLTPVTVFPETEAVLLWENTEPDTVTLEESGLVTALKPGGAKIRVCLAGREDVKAEVSVNVLTDRRELIMPRRTTDMDGIAANMSRIYSVQSSALTELRAHYAAGEISENELKQRTGVINRAFSSYAFPWIVEQPLPYWKAENSDDGTKNFVPGTVYYGLPYISGNYVRNRTYDAATAVAEGRYIKDGDHYVFNPDGLLNGNYAGSDCSAFVGNCFYYNYRIKDIRTQTLAYSGDFRNLAQDATLMPGDIIVSSYNHVVLFLYYANDAHTQIVTIEQGGDEYGTGTVNANTRSFSYYTSRGYVARRFTGFTYYNYRQEDGLT